LRTSNEPAMNEPGMDEEQLKSDEFPEVSE
jgi:hypothetical protein